jgi:hypothetical protein
LWFRFLGRVFAPADGIWDKTVYHKLSNQIYAHADIPAGSKFEIAVIRVTLTDTTGWKDKAKALVDDTRDRNASGAFGKW